MKTRQSENAPDRPKPRENDGSGPAPKQPKKRPREHGGRDGPEPTRYGDWEKDGRAVDF